jgi:hypothetical protein
MGRLKDSMNGPENPIELLVMSVVMIALGIAGVIAGFSRDLRGGLDGLLLLFVSLMMVLIFAALLFVLAKGRGWLGGTGSKAAGSSQSPAPGK